MGVLLDALERLPANIVGHFYVPAIFGHWPDQATLECYEDRMLEIAARQGMAVEFNTRFLYRDHPDDRKAAVSRRQPPVAAQGQRARGRHRDRLRRP